MKQATLIHQSFLTKEILDFQCDSLDKIQTEVQKISSKFMSVDCDEDSYLHTVRDPNIASLVFVDLFPSKQIHFPNIQLVQRWFESKNHSQLIPIVTVDPEHQVLMQAYANWEAVSLTLADGFGTYFSRSRNKLWKKGEESGHLQLVQSVRFCENKEFLLYTVKQTGAACHTGNYTCYYRPLESL